MMYTPVEINGIDLFKEYKAVLTEKHSVQPPVPKTFFQDVPGADGAADLSTVISGRITYERRKIIANFQCEQPENRWATVFSGILGSFHGKQGKLIFGDDPSYYYTGRMEVSGYERNRTAGKFTITMDAEPYKHERQSSTEPWLWDIFNFETGIIRDYANIAVAGKKNLTIQGEEQWVAPVITVSGAMNLTFENKLYQLRPGKNKIYAIAIKPGENALIFEGNGTISVEYRGGKL